MEDRKAYLDEAKRALQASQQGQRGVDLGKKAEGLRNVKVGRF